MKSTVPSFVPARLVLAIVVIVTGSTLVLAQPKAGQKPVRMQAQKPLPPPPNPAQVCEYITPDEAKGLLGVDATASRAPSRGSFTSCGYSGTAGDALTVYIADYGQPSIAKEFFEKTREVLKTATNEDTLGVPAFMHVTPPGPLAAPQAPGTAPAPPPAPGVVMLLALKDHRTVKLEATGPLVTQPHQLPKLRAILTRVVTTLPAPAPAPPR